MSTAEATTTQPGATGPAQGKLRAIAARLGCTEGQLQTVAIGLLVAVVTAGIGLPPVFADRPVAESAVPAPASRSGPPAGGAEAEPPAPVDAGVGGPVTTEPSRPAMTPSPGPGPTSPSPGGTSPTADRPRDAPAATDPTSEEPGDLVALAGQGGSCTAEQRSIDNPRRVGDADPTPVWIFEPGGSGPASVAGGACDDPKRPVVLLAHGFGQTDPAGYQGLIEHLVSVGNIVVYPVYEVADGDRSSLEESTRVVDAGFVAGVGETPRADTTRIGVWGHSHGGGMVAFLTQQVGERGWGKTGLWLSNVAQAFSQLVGADDIPVPGNARAITVVFQHDAFADARLGNDIFRSLVLPAAQKHHATVLSDPSAGIVAEHAAPTGTADESGAIGRLLWRYADLLQLCAFRETGCDADLSSAPGPDGTPGPRAIVSDDPVDVGPYPAILAECDAGFGLMLNPRIARCGPTKI